MYGQPAYYGGVPQSAYYGGVPPGANAAPYFNPRFNQPGPEGNFFQGQNPEGGENDTPYAGYQAAGKPTAGPGPPIQTAVDGLGIRGEGEGDATIMCLHFLRILPSYISFVSCIEHTPGFDRIFSLLNYNRCTGGESVRLSHPQRDDNAGSFRPLSGLRDCS
jgi:hypothetical protein